MHKLKSSLDAKIRWDFEIHTNHHRKPKPSVNQKEKKKNSSNGFCLSDKKAKR